MHSQEKTWEKIHLITEDKMEHSVNARALKVDVVLEKAFFYVFTLKFFCETLTLALLALYQAQV